MEQAKSASGGDDLPCDQDIEDPEDTHNVLLTRHFAKASTEEAAKRDDQGPVRTDAMMYKTSALVTWQAFHVHTNSWKTWQVWRMMFRLGGVSLVVSVCTVLLVPDPAALRVSKFTEISKFLNVLVGLLLGFFLSSAMTRWHECIDGFMSLLDAIRNLQMQLTALGVRREENTLVTRLGLASAWLLYGSLMIKWDKSEGKRTEVAARNMWKLIRGKRMNLDGAGMVPLLADDEIDVLKPTLDHSGMVWLWISGLIGKLAQDGLIPGMATPTYGRIMQLCQDGHGSIRDVRASITVQAPLPYTHTLSIIVHLNGLLSALTMGLVCGVAFGTFLVRENMHIYANKASENEAVQDFQGLFITFLYTFFGPLVYYVLLVISMRLSQPFDQEETSLPLDRLLDDLKHDLKNGYELYNLLSAEERPCFKQNK